MQNVKREFSQRVVEINNFYNLLENIIEKEGVLCFPHDNNKIERLGIEATTILKSNMILLLYNCVESTITNCLVILHQTICNENCKFNELSLNIKNLLTEYYYKNLKEANMSEDNLLLHLTNMINTWIYNSSITLSYEEYTKYKTGNIFSGNLDSKEIKKIAKKYGIEFDAECSQLRIIRDKRNKLAHGEVSFSECCNQDSLTYIKVLKENTTNYLSEFVNAVEEYINTKKYKN